MNYLFTNPILALAIVSALVATILAWLIIDLRVRWNRVFGAKSRKRGEALSEVLQRLLRTEEKIERIEPRLAVLEGIGAIAVQRVGFLRFNPFGNTGSDQSFAICLLDREENGLILSSLYTREGVRVYAKEIKNGVPTHQLSEEEKKVLAQAMKVQ